MTDTDMKVVLTIIALCLIALVVQQATSVASAQFGFGCDGSPQSPCYIRPSQLSFAVCNLRPDVTPPEAAVGNEEENARRWEKATNKADCEEAAGL